MIDPALITRLSQNPSNAEDALSILDQCSRYWLNSDHKAAEDVELVVRLLDRAEVFEEVLTGSKEMILGLVREAGLYPYMQESENFSDDLARELHRVPEIEITFHSEQFTIFQTLLSGKNVILSAPTSFGKTLLVDALIAVKKPKLVIVVVPTIALLEERRRSLTRRFSQYRIVTQAYQDISGELDIIIGTQERIIERGDIPNPDLFVIDEFYKLDLARGDFRAKSLNRVLAEFIDRAKQVYLLGPSIQDNPVDQEARPNYTFIKTSYSPVTADVVNIDPIGTDPARLYDLVNNEIGGPALVYCRSPRSARVTSRELVDRGYTNTSDELIKIAAWLRNNYHSDWYLADALERGIGIHHGRIPRAISHLMVQLFNSRKIDILVCTSTLIEGVNTVAENVIIYDKYISRRQLDRFTFENIKGRAGRMFQHYVGKIFLFNEEPAPEYETLDIPLLKGKEDVSDDILVQIEDHFLSQQSRDRKKRVLERSEVPAEILSRFGSYGLEEIEELYEEIAELLDTGDQTLIWNGYPRYSDIVRSMEVLWGRIDFEKHSVRSVNQFAFLANALRRSDSIREFIEKCASNDDVDEGVDLIFNFLRGAEYTFAEPFKLLEAIVQNLHEAPHEINYSIFVGLLSSWGLPENSKALEELGVPAPIIQRIAHAIDVYAPDEALRQVNQMVASGEVLDEEDITILRITMA